MAPELGPLTQALFRIRRDGHDDRHLGAEICRACVTCLDVHGAAISLLTATTSRTTLSATNPTAATLQDLQFTFGEGTGIEAAASGRPVLIPDMHDRALTARWPIFAAAVAERTGVRALFALPLQMGTINLGVLDLYRTTPGGLREHELRDIVAVIDTAVLLLLAVPTRTDSLPIDAQHPHGRHADGDDASAACADGPSPDGLCRDGSGHDRAEVHQAVGMILAQLGISAQDAFFRLRAHAFVTRRPLADVARDVVARRLVVVRPHERAPEPYESSLDRQATPGSADLQRRAQRNREIAAAARPAELSAEHSLREFQARIETGTPRTGKARHLLVLSALERLRILISSRIAETVEASRQEDATWAEIAAALGVTRQTAHERYRHRPR